MRDKFSKVEFMKKCGNDKQGCKFVEDGRCYVVNACPSCCRIEGKKKGA